MNGSHVQLQSPSVNMHEQVLPSIDGSHGQVQLPSVNTSHGHVPHVESESCLRRTGRVHRPSTRNMVANAIGGNHDEHAHSTKRGHDESNSNRKANACFILIDAIVSVCLILIDAVVSAHLTLIIRLAPGIHIIPIESRGITNLFQKECASRLISFAPAHSLDRNEVIPLFNFLALNSLSSPH
ncbi:uncharacterized protein F5147DRAFT_778485 [Suillus discolor]|uniref:Uncharacterized protein n=1 Tax=Suillus discolor TaxID=1912936 RepID=A0A9P7JP97_9AGAM|nr:uncharacterized protein F5147DRAFT_778485 [Suillus discolor]KAG2096121.1 hypothetical protein F5147DRAFT_778485 [Suillus discolor]